jgi:cleavage and polyadenylation specificity factor subunit 2
LNVENGEKSLNQRSLGCRPQVALPHSIMIGELKLTALKSRLASVGVQAELVGEGVLICSTSGSSPEGLGGSVAVRKLAKGKVEMEGNVSEVYYIVRREIYNLHALVTA